MDDSLTPSITRVAVTKLEGDSVANAIDTLAVEEPLEIRLSWARQGVPYDEPVSITMRTPGHDLELAVGFLVGEGIVRTPADVRAAAHVGPRAREDGTSNVVRIELTRDASHDVGNLARHFYVTSSCGVCGKASIDALRGLGATPSSAWNSASPRDGAHAPLVLAPEVLHGLPRKLRAGQPAFDETGGLHAAAAFDAQGALEIVREDVGRHNAVDKIVGALAIARHLPANDSMLLVSGRASFELVQKALMAGMPVLAAVGAPSSLAVDLARDAGMTLVGFLRDGRFNVYAGRERIRGMENSSRIDGARRK